jgi:[ribosomal protein S5]-alanine N-acetyltransferase
MNGSWSKAYSSRPATAFLLILEFDEPVILVSQAKYMQRYESARLVLRVLEPVASVLVLDYYLRNRDFLQAWEPEREADFFTRRYQEEQLAKDLALIESKDLLRLWISKKGHEDRVIGNIGFNNIVRGAFLSCHLGYKLDQAEINQGYITEAIQIGIDTMFNDYGLHRIEANIIPRNKPSLRVAEKLSFYHEGLANKYLKINGVWEDHIHMVLLNDKI